MANDQRKLGFRAWLGIVIWSLGFIVVGYFFRDLFPRKEAGAKVVTIKSRNLEYQVATKARTVGEFLEEQGLVDYVVPDLIGNPGLDSRFRGNDKIIHGVTINLRQPLEVTIIDGGNAPLNFQTQAETISDFLNEQKIGLARTDRVTPSLETYLSQGINIKIDRIVDLEVAETHEVPFETKLIDDSQVFYGREELVSSGVAGSKEQNFLITYKNGFEMKRKLLSQKVFLKPITEVRKFGTKIVVEESQEGRASWYGYKNCMCAAHPYYQLRRYVRVTSLASGKSMIVTINDRGPDVNIYPDRVIDLDSVAFKTFAPLGAGTIAVKVELLR